MPFCKLSSSSGLYDRVRRSWDGAPLVLLHAFPLDRTMWHLQLQGAGGRSSPSSARPDLARVRANRRRRRPSLIESAVADRVVEFLTVLGVKKAIACGVSMGGYCSRWATLARAARGPALRPDPRGHARRCGRQHDPGEPHEGRSRVANEKGTARCSRGMLPPRAGRTHAAATKPDVGGAREGDCREATGREHRRGVSRAKRKATDLRCEPRSGSRSRCRWCSGQGEFDAVTPPLAAGEPVRQPDPRQQARSHPRARGTCRTCRRTPDAFNTAVRAFLTR